MRGDLQAESLPSPDNTSIDDPVGAWLSNLDLGQTQSGPVSHDLSTYTPHEDANLANAHIDSRKDDYSETHLPEIQGDTDLWLADYHELIPKTEAYQWLRSRLKKELVMIPAKPSFMGTINNLITQYLLSSLPIGYHTPARTYDAEFEIDWDIMTFLEKQQYATDSHETIERIITVTGSYQDSFITTCEQYINQTWPSSGEIIMQLVKDLVDDKARYPTCKSASQRLIIDNDIF